MSGNYKIVTGETTEQLEATINARMKEGWIPQGGPFVIPKGGFLEPDMLIAQAISHLGSAMLVISPESAEQIKGVLGTFDNTGCTITAGSKVQDQIDSRSRQ